MAALAALGGIAGTYINFIGDFFQSILGFAGTTQWAAGLHVVWLILAAGLTRKQGAGTITGILKGAVELFTGNTHGLLVVLVNIFAGVLIDLGLLPFRRKDHWLAYAFAGGIASASNVFVFQLFAALPADILGFGVIGLIGGMAFLSGVVFAGILGYSLLAALRRAGIRFAGPTHGLSSQEAAGSSPGSPGEKPAGSSSMDPPGGNRSVRSPLLPLLGSALLLAGGLFAFLRINTPGGSVEISGAAAAPYQFRADRTSLTERLAEVHQEGRTVTYRGYSLQEIIAAADPYPEYDTVLLTGSDGYTFLISAGELAASPQILLQPRGSGRSLSYNLVGPASKKAWVNGLVEIRLIASTPLPLSAAGQTIHIDPSDWVTEMDSTRLVLENGPGKYQGVPLSLVLDAAFPAEDDSEVLVSGDGQEIVLTMEQVRADDGIRIFVILDHGTVAYALARLDGQVYLENISGISIR